MMKDDNRIGILDLPTFNASHMERGDAFREKAVVLKAIHLWEIELVANGLVGSASFCGRLSASQHLVRVIYLNPIVIFHHFLQSNKTFSTLQFCWSYTNWYQSELQSCQEVKTLGGQEGNDVTIHGVEDLRQSTNNLQCFPQWYYGEFGSSISHVGWSMLPAVGDLNCTIANLDSPFHMPDDPCIDGRYSSSSSTTMSRPQQQAP